MEKADRGLLERRTSVHPSSDPDLGRVDVFEGDEDVGVDFTLTVVFMPIVVLDLLDVTRFVRHWRIGGRNEANLASAGVLLVALVLVELVDDEDVAWRFGIAATDIAADTDVFDANSPSSYGVGVTTDVFIVLNKFRWMILLYDHNKM